MPRNRALTLASHSKTESIVYNAFVKKPLLLIVAIVIVAAGVWYWYAGSTENATLANPASVYCEQDLGGTLEIVNGEAGQIGVCHLPDGRACEEWRLFRTGDCESADTSGASADTQAGLFEDVIPMYDGVTWGEPQVATSDFGLQGVEVVSEPVFDVTNIAAITQPFEKYYHDKLLAAGWVMDNSKAAGGPGAEVIGYKKGSEYVILSYISDFKVDYPDAPSECPCDVTFAVFNGSAQ